MKSLILLLVTILISACKTVKVDYNPLGDLMKGNQYTLEVCLLKPPNELSIR